MKKVLLSMPSYASFLPPIEETFKKLGYETRFFDYRHGDILVKLIRILFGHNLANKLIEYRILNIIKNEKPDIFLTIKGETLSKECIRKIKKYGVITVNWFPDPLSQWSLMKKIAGYYDLFFHFDPLIIKKLERRGLKNIRYLPFASEIRPLKEDTKRFDVSFVGTYHPERERFLKHLKSAKLNIWGDKRWSESSLANFTKGERVSQGEMKNIIRKSKININLHYNAPREGANLRTFEVTGSGGFLLTDWVKDMDNLFLIDKEIVSFKTPKELSQKVKFYLSKKTLREKIAKAGYKKAKSSHNYPKRLSQMLKIINESSKN